MKKIVMAAVFVFLAGPVFASQTAGECSAYEMAREATDIFYATCAAAKVVDLPSSDSAFASSATEYTLKVVGQAIKGKHKDGDVVTFRQKNFRTVEQAAFKNDGGEFIVFMMGPETAIYRATACLAGGKLDIEIDPVSGAKVIKKLPSGKSAFFKDAPVHKASFSKSLNAKQKDIITKTDSDVKIAKDDFEVIIKQMVREQEGRE